MPVQFVGNKSGLPELARLMLLVAARERTGAHQDIDRSGFASKADGILTIALNNEL